jgi:hypothetical protein
MSNFQINQKLSDSKSGNYLIQVTKIGDRRRSKFCSYEYYCDVDFVISDLTNPDKKNGVVCSGFGSKPIELNTNIKYYNSMYWDWQNFEDELLTRLLRDQNNINQNGYYPKERN